MSDGRWLPPRTVIPPDGSYVVNTSTGSGVKVYTPPAQTSTGQPYLPPKPVVTRPNGT